MIGVPNQIKTDNGTGYYCQAFEMFYRQFNITHITEIPYNSQGQGIVELENNIILKNKRRELYPCIPHYLNHALFF
jgi:transposase InsO family protein